MDRRDALKRLAAGSATVAGASVIVSQPAFAFTNPTVTGSPTVSVTTTGRRSASISISAVPSGACPGSAVSVPGPTQASLTWTTFWPGGATQMSSGSGAGVTIPAGFDRWFGNDRIRVTLVYRYQCVYAGATAEICVEWFREFTATNTWPGTTWALVGSSSTGPTTVACPPGLLTASRSSGVEMAPGGRTFVEPATE